MRQTNTPKTNASNVKELTSVYTMISPPLPLLISEVVDIELSFVATQEDKDDEIEKYDVDDDGTICIIVDLC